MEGGSVADLRLASILLTGFALVALPGCARRVEVALPAMPAVTLTTSEVAVVATGRECRPVADALVRALTDLEGMRVDPGAPVRLEVRECAHPIEPMVQVEINGDERRRRVTVEGRAHALVVVRIDGLENAHLI